MKSLIAALILMTIIVSGTIINSKILTGTLEKLYESLEKHPEEFNGVVNAEIDATTEYLKKIRGYLYFTLPTNTLDELYSEYRESCEYYNQQEIPSYRATLEKVKEKVSLLMSHEHFTVSNIF